MPLQNTCEAPGVRRTWVGGGLWDNAPIRISWDEFSASWTSIGLLYARIGGGRTGVNILYVCYIIHELTPKSDCSY